MGATMTNHEQANESAPHDSRPGHASRPRHGSELAIGDDDGSSSRSSSALTRRAVVSAVTTGPVVLTPIPTGTLATDDRPSGTGTTITADSCAESDVRDAIERAGDGDTVELPPGQCEWTTSVTIPDDKRITLAGSGSDSTEIIGEGELAIFMGLSGSRITGLGLERAGVQVDGDGWRIDHCRMRSNGVQVRGSREDAHPRGVVDNCVFHNARVVVLGWAGLEAHGLWAQPLGLGTDRAVYVEDCEFTHTEHGNAMDANYGGSYVFRHNTLTDTYVEAHSLQGTHRATRKFEIYGNRFEQVDRSMWSPFFLRGGTGVVYDNVVNGTWSSPRVTVDNVRSFSDRGDGGRCDGTSDWDGNEDETGYPCRDQIGRSTDHWRWTDDDPYPPQEHEPLHVWDNVHESGEVTVNVHNCPDGDGSCLHIQADRDYVGGTAHPDYEPYTYPHPIRNGADGTADGFGPFGGVTDVGRTGVAVVLGVLVSSILVLARRWNRENPD